MKRNQMIQLIIFAWTGFIVTSYNACGGFRAVSGNNLSSRALEDAFGKTVHPLLVTNCATCHREDAAAPVAPFFAADDPHVSWEATKSANSINFDDAAASRVVQRLVVDQHNCWSGNCQADGDEMLAKVEEMIALSGPQEPDLRIHIGSLKVPPVDTLPDRNTGFQTFEWSLSGIGLNGTLKVDIQNFDGAYRFAAPKLTGLSKNLKVKSLMFKVNDVYRQQENTFGAIDMESTEVSNRQLSAATLLVNPEFDDAGVSLEIDVTPTFEIIEEGTGTPRSTPAFAAVQSILSTSCVSCHGAGGGNQGGRNFESYAGVMEAPDDPNTDEEGVTLPVAVKPGDPFGSFLYTSVTKQPADVGFMPQGGAQLSQTSLQTVYDWIIGGAQP